MQRHDPVGVAVHAFERRAKRFQHSRAHRAGRQQVVGGIGEVAFVGSWAFGKCGRDGKDQVDRENTKSDNDPRSRVSFGYGDGSHGIRRAHLSYHRSRPGPY